MYLISFYITDIILTFIYNNDIKRGVRLLVFQLIGRPYMPPYWALGFQLCRYGYNSLENLQAAVNRTLAADIPLVHIIIS